MGKYNRRQLNPYLILLISLVGFALLLFVVFFVIKLINQDKIDYYEARCEYFAVENKEIEYCDYVFVGDSIVENYPQEELQRISHSSVILNRGINDDTTLGLKNRLDESVYATSPRWVIIMIGAGDLATPRSVNAIAKTYKEIVYDIFDNIPTTSIYIVSVIPQNSDYSGFSENNIKRIKELNAKLEAFADTCAAVYVNIYDVLADENGYLKKEYSDNGFSLNSVGYAALTDFFDSRF